MQKLKNKILFSIEKPETYKKIFEAVYKHSCTYSFVAEHFVDSCIFGQDKKSFLVAQLIRAGKCLGRLHTLSVSTSDTVMRKRNYLIV